MAKVLVDENSLSAIANAIREINGTTDTYKPSQMAAAVRNIMDSATYILVDEDGNEMTATYVDSATVFDAAPNDIRKGKTAATDAGVTLGTKEIPAYYTSEGKIKIESGEQMAIKMYSDRCQYTKLQALICTYNTTPDDSVATEKVSVNNKVYSVNSTTPLADVTVDIESQTINLGVVNNSETPIIIRYFTFKEEQ